MPEFARLHSMRLVIATPLYPPDIAEPAPYVKELARRLSPIHEVTIVAYGSHPEQVGGVRIIAVDKHKPLPLRLIAFFFALAKASSRADVLLVENGASVELPAGILARLKRIHVVLHIGDAAAHERIKYNPTLARIESFLTARAHCVLEDKPLPHPEVLPFAPKPDQTAYDASWESHLTALTSCFHV